MVTKCESNEEAKLTTNKGSKLEIGSPIIVTEAPQMLKTAASVPCLRINAGLVKPGDVGRYNQFTCLYTLVVKRMDRSYILLSTFSIIYLIKRAIHAYS